MSRSLRRFTFHSFTFCTVLSPPSRLPSPPTHTSIVPSTSHPHTPPPLRHHLHPSKPHSNVLRNYSEVNRAGCRNEITAAGLSARAREAIRQQEMTRRLHQQPTAAAAANPPQPSPPTCIHNTVARIPPVPPCGKVMQLRPSKARSPSVKLAATGQRCQMTGKPRSSHACQDILPTHAAQSAPGRAARLRATADIKGN